MFFHGGNTCHFKNCVINKTLILRISALFVFSLPEVSQFLKAFITPPIWGGYLM